MSEQAAASAESHDLDLLALLCSRLCHDLVGPVGAVANGVELIEEGDPDLLAEAQSLISQSADQAVRRLRFFRLAFGAAQGARISERMAQEAAEGMLREHRVELDWPFAEETSEAGKADEQTPLMKLALNLTLLGAGALPRGGRIRVNVVGAARRLELVSSGAGARVDERTAAALKAGAAGEMAHVAELDARSAHAFFTGRLVRSLNLKVDISAAGGEVRLILT